MTPHYAGIDAGGTSFKCLLASGPKALLAEAAIPVTTPNATLTACADFFREAEAQHGRARALGLACFGPIDCKPDSPHYGTITSTPKPGWRNTAIVAFFEAQLGLPIGFDTDVNAALLAETQWGAAEGEQNALYATVGTGIGMGAMVASQRLHGELHPEVGHMRVARLEGDAFAGICPYHSDCLEGLASGPALTARAGQPLETLANDHPVWDTAAYYLGSLCWNAAVHYAPAKIILGGGVMQRQHLLAPIRRVYQSLNNGYLTTTPDHAIVLAGLGPRAGALGAIALAQTASTQKHA